MFAAALTAALAVAGCADRAVQVTQWTLFSVAVGPLEDQVAVAAGYQQAGVRLSMSAGLFYVANAPVRKVMRFSSFGDLLLLLYHPELNPQPVGLTAAGPDTVSTRMARSILLGPIGRVGADSDGTIYLQEQLDASDWESDGGVTRSYVVRRFDRTGADRGYLGREGLAGTPFGFVERLQVTEQAEPFLVTRDVASWQVFWFDRNGLLRYRRRVTAGELAGPDSGPGAVEIVSVVADARGPPHLLVEAVTQPGGRSALWRVSGDGVPSWAFAAPRSSGAPFRLVGAASGRLFFVARAGPELTLLYIIDDRGRALAQVDLSLQDPTLQLSELQVSADGVLYGARIGPERVDFLWWRTDLLIKRR